MAEKAFQPLISFLSVNYNQPAVSIELLDSLQKLSYPRWEIVVVDNGSQPSDLKEQCAKYAGVKFVRSEENLGFAGGNNYGLSHCEGDYIFLINNDTEVPPDFLEPIVDLLAEQPRLGALSCKIRFFDQPDTLQYAGFTPMSKITIRNAGIGFGEADSEKYSQNYTTHFCHGAAMLVPRKVIEAVGTMYDGYFLYYEEYDWAQRIKDAGYEIWYCGKSHLLHKESVSTGKNSPLKMYYLTRNRLLFARRNYAGSTMLLTWLYFSLVALPKNILVNILKGDWKLARAFWQGYIWNFNNKAQPA